MSRMDALPIPKSRYSALNSQQDFQHDLGYDSSIPAGPQHQPQGWKSEKRMSGGRTTIIVALLCIMIPMLGLAGLLIGLVLGHQVERQESGTGGPFDFVQKSDTDDSAYYVNFNATTLATIASWSSTVAPLLAVAAMALASFPIGKKLRDNSIGEGKDLPTPFQFGLLLETLTGGITAFLSLGAYSSWNHKEKMASMLRSSFIILFVASAIGYAVAGVDTWLHLVMDTVQVVVPAVGVPERNFSRAFLNSEQFSCTNYTAGQFDTSFCTVSMGQSNFLTGANEAYKTLANLSSINSVRTADVDGKQMAFTGPANIPSNLDFQATSPALHTQCTPVSQKCNLHTGPEAFDGFKCTDAFYGDVAVPTINDDDEDVATGFKLETAGVAYYSDPGLQKPANATLRTTPRNPYYLGSWGIVGLTITDAQSKDPNYVVPGHGGVSWILNCTSTAYDLTYSWVNGSVSSANATIANGTIGTYLQSAMFYGFGRYYLNIAAYAASAQEKSQDTADSFAIQYSRIAMGLTSGTFEGRSTLAEQTRKTILVSRVPKVPLYFLIALNVLYALFGVALACIALASFPSETNDVRERLSYAGLVAYCFEGARAKRPAEKKREMFAECEGDGGARIGLERSAYEGWEYTKREELRKTEMETERGFPDTVLR